MSSMKVFNRVQSFFPEGLLLDQSGNCFNLFMEFPTKDGRKASVLIWEECVWVYSNNGQYLTKEEHLKLNEEYGDEHMDESFRDHEHMIFSTDDVYHEEDWDDEDKVTTTYNPSPNDIFDNNTMIEIGKTWSKFNQCFWKAMRGE